MRRRRLRIGNAIAGCSFENSGKVSELPPPAFGHQLPEPGSRSVKYWNGVVAAHSWPMKSSGVIGAVSRTTLAARQASAGDAGVQPVADRAVADLVVVLKADDEAIASATRDGSVPRGRPRCTDGWPGEEPALA